ncbi:hypothetical protein A2331_00020 [Candidatus Falkowbacteria bacterium RIFOXYB2_FULL_34_18]|uniref:Uncharacterized protein n=1 Tax=Candidatus Falkowbacteria bacterium RIFOXYD2_FULL_34_120 TaxID=1798007 RepID=A0A1F5TSE2_9BACT|nr:MAG: hypothetical protein A2331_00020 [Candidatus Falkowbacteria bacterium RIFOXYB2_FULL_34_18]OGF37482.1 MAG: hypothetical protein A2466_00580 [Candidatus Falkowbacteria bacterium RIFOXYC2_FULL_34_220]OGF39192.1 MAG: hypothetical protein A2515_01090 [Candidatus Falkowbacteria bacterium RIFOXYD12_FULL_34_57]OGF41759.1 MAG: hypothetical protein A2531_05750 [Candidatus Falkowbacteria bacterium RIFOXYD2_FULL_34_120]
MANPHRLIIAHAGRTLKKPGNCSALKLSIISFLPSIKNSIHLATLKLKNPLVLSGGSNFLYFLIKLL